MSKTESVMELLAKLMRHEQSAREVGSLAEAEAFASKVQAMLTKHKLEMSEIKFEEREQSEPIDEEMVMARDVGIKFKSKRVFWQESLASSIAACNGCELLINNRSNTVFFVGRTSDRKVCAQIYGRFVRMAFDLAENNAEESRDVQREKCQARYGRIYSGAVFAQWMRSYKTSFCSGFSVAIQDRFTEQNRQMEVTKKEAEGEGCSAMVHIQKDKEAVSAHIQKMFEGRKESKAKPNFERNNINREGYKSGQAAGNTVALASHDLPVSA